MPDPQPIIVNDSPLPDQLWAGLRQVAPAVVAFMVGRHLIADDTVTMISVAGGVIWPIVAGQLKTRRRAQQLATIAASPQVPDSVARVKSPIEPQPENPK